MDPNWSEEEYKQSDLRKTIDGIVSMGFEPVSFRFVKHFSEDGRELTTEKARKLPKYEMFDMYIDLLVDTDDDRRNKLVGFSIAEELLLKEIFTGKRNTMVNYKSTNVIVPEVSLLLEMKITSFPNRTKDDKRTKDLADICALLLYSNSKLPTLDEVKKNKFEKALSILPEEEWDRIASILDEEKRDLKRVVTRIE